MRRLLWSLMALGLLVGGAEPAKADYIFTTLDVPGSTLTQAYGINDSGQVVGLYEDTRGLHGFLFSGGAYTSLDVPGPNWTQPNGINASGEIVGWYNGVQNHGFLLNGGNYTTLDVPGAIFTIATGINNAGQVVGTWGNGQRTFPFLLSGITYTTFNTPGSYASGAYGINNAGQIVGYNQTTGDLRTHGFLLSGGGTNYTSIDVPGAYNTETTGINDFGQIVGFYDQNGIEHGFLMSNGSYATLDVLGATSTQVWGINDLGDIVGNYTDASGNEHGFLATPAVAPIPEPATLLLLCVGTVGVISVRARLTFSEIRIRKARSTAAGAALAESGLRPRLQPLSAPSPNTVKSNNSRAQPPFTWRIQKTAVKLEK